MPIVHSDIGSDEDAARRVLVRARHIAPCITAFPDDSEEKRDALAILKGVYAEMPESGSRRTRSLSRNGTAITFDNSPVFSDEDVAALRALCASSTVSSGAPRGSFPIDTLFPALWPGERYQ